MIRKFYLKNKKNEIYDLNNVDFFFSSPQGLGLQQSINLLRLGNENIVTNSYFEHMAVSGDVLFMNTSNATIYQNYLDFTKFSLNGPIFLYYETPNNNEPYFCEVVITKIDKNEITEDGILHAPVEMQMLTFWVNATIHERVVVAGTLEGKKYQLVRKLKEGYFYGVEKLKKIVINNDGTVSSGVEIEIVGAITNPQISFYDEDGKQFGVSKFVGTFDYVLINSSDRNENVVLKKGESILANPVSYQDLSVGNGSLETTFCKLKIGTNILSVGFANKFDGAVAIRWRDTYASI